MPASASTLDELTAAIEEASRDVDLVEVRLDHLPAGEFEAGARLAQTEKFAVPLILTLRPIEQGGRAALTLTQRRDFWRTQTPGDQFFDWELDLTNDLAASAVTVDWDRIICSYHDFDRVPLDLEGIFRRMLATPAQILKLAVMTHEVADSLALFRLLALARPVGRKVIAVAMGETGIVNRVLAPAWGSYLSYASSRPGQATAPGQVTVSELRGDYRFHYLDKGTELYGVIGAPVAHSLSPAMHNAAFLVSGRNAVFFPLPVRDCASFLRRMVHPRTREWPFEWRGLSVTAPHKRSVLEQLDRLDPVAEEIGAVNTIVVRDGELLGTNTDAEGFIAPLRRRFIDLRGLRCAVIGAGGAARAAIWALQRSGALTTIFARHPDRGRLLGREFAADFTALADASFAGFEMVVQTTPLGTTGRLEHESPVTAAQLRGVRLVYDLVYRPGLTAFLRAGEEAGCATIGGLEMLVAQAAIQYELWTGADAPAAVMKVTAELMA